MDILTDPQTWMFFAIGLIAQMFDGVLGMGFGVVSSTVMTVIGFPRAVVSAAVNGAKIFTGIASGLSHAWYKNVDWRLFLMLGIAGLIGGIFGASLISYRITHIVGPIVSAYLVGVGIYIVWRALHEKTHRISGPRVAAVGFAGGILEAISGVWGPLVTSGLIAMGVEPRHAVGTGNMAETIVAVTVFTMLAHQTGLDSVVHAVAGLIIGAIIASPIAARFTHRVPRRRMMVAVGILVIVSSVVRLLRDAGWLG